MCLRGAPHLIGAEEGIRDRLSLPNPYEEERGEAWTAVEGLSSAEDRAGEI
ncbi:hypothetical protein GCM10028802_38160 [Terrabacter terrigena]